MPKWPTTIVKPIHTLEINETTQCMFKESVESALSGIFDNPL